MSIYPQTGSYRYDAIRRAGRPPGVVDVGISIAYLLLLLPGLAHSLMLSSGIHTIEAEIALAATSAAAGALVFRRRAPILVLAVTVVLLVGVKTLLCGFPDPLGIAIAGYAVTAYLPRRRGWVAASIAAGVIVFASAAIALVLYGFAPLTGGAFPAGVLVNLNLVVFLSGCGLGFLVTAVRVALARSDD